MKKIIALILAVATLCIGFGCLNVAASDPVVVFEDAIFESYVRGLISKPSGTVLASDVSKINIIEVQNMGIKSLKGIEHMTALTTLNCENNMLTSLDLRGCRKMTYLRCDRNRLTSLNTAGCIYLTGVYCIDNNLTSLNFSGLSRLQSLNCEINKLTSLDISGCTRLKFLEIRNNSFTSLDISNCPSIVSLACDVPVKTATDNVIESLTVMNYNQASYDLTGFPNLLYFHLSGTSYKLTSIDFSKTPKLKGVDIIRSGFTSIDVSACPEIIYISLYECKEFSDFKAAADNSIRSIQFIGCNFTSFDAGSYTNAELINLRDNKLTSLNLSKNTKLLALDINSNDFSTIDVSASPSVNSLDLGNNKNLTSFKVPSGHKIQYLELENCNISSFNAELYPKLYRLCLSGNPITSLDLSKNYKLQTLEILGLVLPNITEIIAMKDVGIWYTDAEYTYYSYKSGTSSYVNVFFKAKGGADLRLGFSDMNAVGYQSAVKPVVLKELRGVTGMTVKRRTGSSNAFQGSLMYEKTGGDIYAEFVFEAPKKGDLDANGDINLSDIIILRNGIMSNFLSDRETALCDLDDNKIVNLSDIVTLRNIIMS